MTEDAWQKTRRGAVAMIMYAGGRVGRRKQHLIGAAIYQHVLADRPPEVALVERYAEGLADEAEFAQARDRLYAVTAEYGSPAMHLQFLLNHAVYSGTKRLVDWATTYYSGYSQPVSVRTRGVCEIIREIAGNPFRPWQSIPEAMGGGLVQPDGQTVRVTAAARAIAEGIAADQGFDRLPVLADALEDGGVTDADLLAHCRRPGGHLRGCWAVDVALGRA